MCGKKRAARRADYLDAIALAVSRSVGALEVERMQGEPYPIQPDGADSLVNLRKVMRGLAETADEWRDEAGVKHG
jgi:hypothetical protein